MKNNKKNELIDDNAFETCLYKTKYIVAADIIPFAFLISIAMLSTLNVNTLMSAVRGTTKDPRTSNLSVIKCNVITGSFIL